MEKAIHPAANIYPLMDDGSLLELAEDIKDHGLLHPIVLCEGMVLDGRNRLRACELAGVEPQFVDWAENGHSATEYVIAVNEKRRHLTRDQRATAAALALPLLEEEARRRQLSGLRHQAPSSVPYGTNDDPQRVGRSRQIAAERFDVSPQQVARAKSVLRHAPELFEEVREGKRTVWNAVVAAGLEKSDTERGRVRRQEGPRKRAVQTPGTKRYEVWAKSAKERLTRGLATIWGISEGLKTLDMELVTATASDQEIEAWNKQASQSVASIREVQRQLKEGANGHQE